jgi:hypothetical protein
MERDPYSVLQIGRSADWTAVRAAYRSLARRYHPDGSHPDTVVMTRVNAAYETIESERRERRERPGFVPIGPALASASGATGGTPAGPPPGSLLWRVLATQQGETPMLEFGQYAGWRIADVARHDPRYLRWLSRHSSGVRYRKVIQNVLGADAEIGRRAAILD